MEEMKDLEFRTNSIDQNETTWSEGTPKARYLQE